MKIKSLQKTTLVDFPGKIACIVFLHGCNFRCGFCHNPELVVEDKLDDFSQKEFFDFLEKRKGDLEGVCITGGEPLICLEKDFLKKIKDLGFEVKVDTNGSFSEKLKEFIDEGLIDYIAMDIKTCKEKYCEVSGVNVNLKEIEESMKILHEFGKYEFRTTIVESLHSEEDIKKMGEWVFQVLEGKGKKIFLQGFKNQGKFVDKKFEKEKNAKEEFLMRLKNILEDYFNEVGVRV